VFKFTIIIIRLYKNGKRLCNHQLLVNDNILCFERSDCVATIRARIVAEGAMPRLTSLLRSPVNINPTTQTVDPEPHTLNPVDKSKA